MLSFVLFGAFASHAAAQHYVAVKDGDKIVPVVAAKDCAPMVFSDGRLCVARNTSTFAIGKGGEYLPAFVSVRDMNVKTSCLVDDGDQKQMNNDFHLHCTLETAFRLKNVFIVLVLHMLSGKSSLFLFEVGELEPRIPKQMLIGVPMRVDSDWGHYEFFLFSGGRELFQSMMPVGEMESALGKMVMDSIKDVEDAPVKPFFGPPPEYPKALFRKKVAGSATVSFKVGVRGAVLDPSVVTATAPEFGEAALAAIRQWRFLPKVKAGRPLETRATMPFDFCPPEKD